MGQVIAMRRGLGRPSRCAPPHAGELSSAERETEGDVHSPLRFLAALETTSPVNGGGSPAKNLEALVGAAGWARLPAAVIARFGGAAMAAEFAGEGEFEASWVGRIFARLGLLFGRPLPAHVGAARVFIRVRPTQAGE